MNRVAVVTLLLLAASLAGCADTPVATRNPPTCPYWVGSNHDLANLIFGFHQNETTDNFEKSEIAPARTLLYKDDKPLDRLQVAFQPRDTWHAGIEVHDAFVELTVTRVDDGTPLRAYHPLGGPVGSAENPGRETWRWGATDEVPPYLIVPLTDKEEAARPTQVSFVWRFFGNLDANPSTIAEAHIGIIVEPFYRACDAPG